MGRSQLTDVDFFCLPYYVSYFFKTCSFSKIVLFPIKLDASSWGPQPVSLCGHVSYCTTVTSSDVGEIGEGTGGGPEAKDISVLNPERSQCCQSVELIFHAESYPGP